ncbi:MAG: hypothetical protein K2H87_04950 [Duncaniella sp.]|nr:hypothetical protein [Duncaniella sp.]
MERNQIVTAPAVVSVSHTYKKWRETHHGSRDDFYRFMTEPSMERTRFVGEVETEVTATQSLAMETVTAPSSPISGGIVRPGGEIEGETELEKQP